MSAPAERQVHNITKTVQAGAGQHRVDAALKDRRNANVVSDNLVGQETAFKGPSRVAQVLRWVSTAALTANKPSAKADRNKKTPEVQASVVGGRVLLGTNIDSDANQAHLPNALAGMLANQGGALDAAMASNDRRQDARPEDSRLKRQERRHVSKLQAFVHDDDYFDQFVAASVGEIREQRNQNPDFRLSENPMDQAGANRVATAYKSFEDQELQMRSMFSTIRDSLRAGQADNGPRVEMAGAVQGKHAEQRIIEQVQGNHDAEETATRRVRNKPPLPDVGAVDDDIAPVHAMPPIGNGATPTPSPFQESPNRRVNLDNSASYAIPKHNWDLDSPARQRAKAKLEAAMDPKNSGRTSFLAGPNGLVHTPDTLSPKGLTMPLAGTKPPCDHCSTTERARHMVAQAAQPAQVSPLEVTRFEDHDHTSGPIFPGQYRNTSDPRVRAQTQVLFADAVQHPATARNSTSRRRDSVRLPPAFPQLGDNHR